MENNNMEIEIIRKYIISKIVDRGFKNIDDSFFTNDKDITFILKIVEINDYDIYSIEIDKKLLM
jgi:hypothetical protein